MKNFKVESFNFCIYKVLLTLVCGSQLLISSDAKLLYHEEIKTLQIRQRFDSAHYSAYILQFYAFNRTFKLYVHRQYYRESTSIQLGNIFKTKTDQLSIYEGVIVNNSESYVTGVLLSHGIFYGSIRDKKQTYHIDSPKRFDISRYKSHMIMFRQSDLMVDIFNQTFCKVIRNNETEVKMLNNQSKNNGENMFNNATISKRQSDADVSYDYVVFIISPVFFDITVRNYFSKNSWDLILLMLFYVDSAISMSNSLFAENTDIGFNFRMILTALHIVTEVECKTYFKKVKKSICEESTIDQTDVYKSTVDYFRKMYPKLDSIILVTYRPNAKVNFDGSSEYAIGITELSSFCNNKKKTPAFIVLNPDQHGKDLDSVSMGYVLTHEFGHTFGAKHDDETKIEVCMREMYIMQSRFDTVETMKRKFSPCSIKTIKEYITNSKRRGCLNNRSKPSTIKCLNSDDCKSGGECKYTICDSKKCNIVNMKDFSSCGKGKNYCVNGKCKESICKTPSAHCKVDGDCTLRCLDKHKKCSPYLSSSGKKLHMPEGTICKHGNTHFCSIDGNCVPLEGNMRTLGATLTSPCLIIHLLHGLNNKYSLILIILISTISIFGMMIFFTFGNESTETTIGLFKEDIYRWSFQELKEMVKTAACGGKIHLGHRKTIVIDEENKNFCYYSVRSHLKRYPYLFRTRKFATVKYEHKSPEFLTGAANPRESLHMSKYRRFSSVMIARESLHKANRLDDASSSSI